MNNKLWLAIGAGTLLVLIVSALFAPLITPHHPLRQSLSEDLTGYSADHPLGTDKLGRDILSRILHGGRISLLVGISTVTLSLAIGLIVGSLSGYCGGWIDQLAMRLVDILLAFPGILLAIAFTAVLGPGHMGQADRHARAEQQAEGVGVRAEVEAGLLEPVLRAPGHPRRGGHGRDRDRVGRMRFRSAKALDDPWLVDERGL